MSESKKNHLPLLRGRVCPKHYCQEWSFQGIGKQKVGYGIFFIVLLLLIWTIWGNTALTVTKITVSSEKIPPAFSGFRIAHISDLHNAEFGESNQKLLQKLSDSNPDIIRPPRKLTQFDKFHKK